jgi:hypothetical protein
LLGKRRAGQDRKASSDTDERSNFEHWFSYSGRSFKEPTERG